MRKGRLAVVTVFGSLAVGLAACTVLSGRVYNSVLYDIVPWLVTGMVCVIPTVLCGKTKQGTYWQLEMFSIGREEDRLCLKTKK